MARRFEPLAGVIASVEVDEDGFVLVGVAHSACGASMSYASGPLDEARAPVSCGKCGEPLLMYSGEESTITTDATGL